MLAELAVPTYPHGQEALGFTVEIPVLDVTEEVLGLARVLVNEKVMPGPLIGDSVHVAVAIHYGMEYVLSWNVKHLANPNKRPHLTKVCLKVGKIPPMIVTPEVLWEPGNE